MSSQDDASRELIITVKNPTSDSLENEYEQSVLMVQQHRPTCKNWIGIHSEAMLVKYVYYCLRHLQSKEFICGNVAALHMYAQHSDGFLPNSLQDLAYFCKTGAIPTPNLHLLQPRLSRNEQCCATCRQNIAINTEVFELDCGHVFHTHHTQREYDLLTWLQSTNICPCCNTPVRFGTA